MQCATLFFLLHIAANSVRIPHVFRTHPTYARRIFDKRLSYSSRIGEGSWPHFGAQHQLIIDPKLLSSIHGQTQTIVRRTLRHILLSLFLTKEIKLHVPDIMLVLDDSNHVDSPVLAWICHLQKVSLTLESGGTITFILNL